VRKAVSVGCRWKLRSGLRRASPSAARTRLMASQWTHLNQEQAVAVDVELMSTLGFRCVAAFTLR
jgi:hypothetical protein